MTLQRTFARSLVTVRTWPFVIDMGVAACGLAIFFAIVGTGRYWLGKPAPIAEISHSISALPLYAFYSIIRIGIAYLLSLVFAIAYGYIAAYNPRIEPWMVAVLDILQSIPVLSFLPPVVLFMVALIPGHQLGIEMAVILLIFTGQVWNLAFSFYSSLKSIPREMVEASRIYRYSAWQRFWQLEMPYATIGWSGIPSSPSPADGSPSSRAKSRPSPITPTSFLESEAIFRWPPTPATIARSAFGIAAVILIVVATDQLVWRPLIAWSDKFKFEQVESADRVRSPILALLRRSSLLSSLPSRVWTSIEEPIYRRLSRTRECRVVQPVDEEKSTRNSVWFYLLAAAAVGVVGWGALQAVIMLRTVSWPDLKLLFEGAAATFGRVNAALLISAAWTIPVGVAIGLNPRLSRIVQPTAQVLASIPATAFFPIILIGLVKIGGGLGIGSIALMLLGTQWYILFNVIAGAMSIPSDLREVCFALSLHPLATLDQAHSSRNIPLSHHRHGHGLRRCMERLCLRRILPPQRQHPADHRPRRRD